MIFELIIGFLYLFSDILFWIKWAAAVAALWLKKNFQHRRFDLYDFEVENQPEKLNIIVPNQEKILESPLPEERLQKCSDEVFIYGVNTKSQAVMVRISRTCNDESGAWIYLKLDDNRWYGLLENKGFQRNFDGECKSFTCGGLQMHYLSAMRRWRIVYCGMLSESTNSSEQQTKEVFVKFTFIWTASSDVYDASSDQDIYSTADAMAQANWNSPFPPVHKAAKTLNFYAQSGVLNGVVSIEDEPDTEMLLFGERIRYLGEGSYLAGSKFKLILGVVPETGLTLHLQKASVPNTFHNLYFGFIVKPNSDVSIIEEGVIISRKCVTDDNGKDLTAMIKAGKQYELCGNFIGKSLHFTSEQGWNARVEMSHISFEIDELKGSGFIISGEISKLPQKETLKAASKLPHPLSKTRLLTVCFAEEESHLPQLTGGKGSSLGKLTKLSTTIKSEFIVPRGMIVTTEAYKIFLTSEILEKIENLKNIAYGNIKGSIHGACKIVQTAVERAYLPDKVTKEIECQLNKLFKNNINNVRFAIRSSATGEDTDQMSAAGQMETFLGVHGIKELFTAVKKCWASQFGYIPVEYKRQNGQLLNTPMAVVIQEMVECESSGVLFTCDPVTNKPSVIVITANYGLGESVVSGSEEPDTVVLQKLSNKDVQIENVIVGLKEHSIVLKDGNALEEGTVIEDVPEDKRNECCISTEMAIKLGKLSLNIEDYFKSPRDIEWGFKDNNIYIFQSRPVTTSSSTSDFEIKHEFDGPLRCEGDFFTRCNVGEAMPGAMSTLGMDVLKTHFGAAFQKKSMKRRNQNRFQETKYFSTGLVPFCSQLHLSVIDMIGPSLNNETLMGKSMMTGVFGRPLDDPEMASVAMKRFESNNMGILFHLLFLRDLFFCGRGIKDVKEQVFNYKCPDKKGKTSKEVFDLLTHSCSHTTRAITKHISCSGMSSVWNMFMLTVIANSKGGLDNDVYSDFAKFLASSTNVESADVPSAMQELAQSITKDIKKEKFGEMSVDEAQNWLETSSSCAGKCYRKFMKRHGHRSIKELDVYSIPWSVDPKPLIKLLQNISGCCEDVKEKTEAKFSNILPQLTVPLSFKSRLLIKFILPNSRRGVREREFCKSNMVKAFDNVRKGLRHLSKCMVAEGYLPEEDLTFFMTMDEINDLLETRNPRIIARAKHRRKLFPFLDSLTFPEISKGSPVPVNEQEDDFVEVEGDLIMKGIPVSQGTVKGYARVAPTLKEAADLEPGEILITNSTDIGWSPYFPILAGVVTELGGLISHGAVVSREYGLPCVVGLHGATKQFVTGDYVLLDGNKGLLQRIASPNSC